MIEVEPRVHEKLDSKIFQLVCELANEGDLAVLYAVDTILRKMYGKECTN